MYEWVEEIQQVLLQQVQCIMNLSLIQSASSRMLVKFNAFVWSWNICVKVLCVKLIIYYLWVNFYLGLAQHIQTFPFFEATWRLLYDRYLENHTRFWGSPYDKPIELGNSLVVCRYHPVTVYVSTQAVVWWSESQAHKKPISSWLLWKVLFANNELFICCHKNKNCLGYGSVLRNYSWHMLALCSAMSVCMRHVRQTYSH